MSPPARSPVITAATLAGNLTGSVSGDYQARSRATSGHVHGDCGVICGNVGEIGGDVRERRRHSVKAIIKGDVRLFCGSTAGDDPQNKVERKIMASMYKNISEILKMFRRAPHARAGGCRNRNSCTPSSLSTRRAFRLRQPTSRNEPALHGVARAGTALFRRPSPWPPCSTLEYGGAHRPIIAEEPRKIQRIFPPERHDIYKGRPSDPRTSTFSAIRAGAAVTKRHGEDPFLTATLGVRFVKAYRATTRKSSQASACAKHFAVHSGPESLRHEFDAVLKAGSH